MKNIKDITDLRIGMTIASKRTKFPMQITGIFCPGFPKLDNDRDTVYADFEGNEGDVFEYSVNEIYIEDGTE